MIRRARPWLGTIVELATDAPEAVEPGFAAVAHVHSRMSFHTANSDLAALRDAKAGEAVAIDRDTVCVLRIAARLFAESGGLYDITIGRRLVATGFLPVVSARPLAHFNGNANDIEIVDDQHVKCHRPVLIDLGGVAKGYAIDLAVAAMQAAGARRGIVNAGGDLRVFGDEPETVWLRGADGRLWSGLKVQNTALASSSNLLFRRRSRGTQVSPHLGLDRRSLLSDQSFTVIAPDCALADAMTKIAMADAELAKRLLADVGGSIIASPSTRLAA